MDIMLMLRLAAFLCLVFMSGYAFARVVLHERSCLVLWSFTACFGPAMLIVLVNVLGYIVTIRAATLIASGVLLVPIAAYAYVHFRMSRTDDVPPRLHAIVLWLVVLLAAFATARFAGSDPWAWQHFPLASTIAEGNLPVHEPHNPAFKLSYHYGAALLAAVFRIFTGFSIAAGFAWQPLIGAAGIVFGAAAFVRMSGYAWRAVTISSLLALGGTGLVWLKTGSFVIDLFNHFILGNTLDVPFRNLVPSFSSPFTSSLLMTLGHRSFTLGAPFLFLLLYSFARAVGQERLKDFYIWIAMALLFALALAHTMESTLLIVLIAFFCLTTFVVIMRAVKHEKRMMLKSLLIASVIISTLALVLAKLQGGVLSGGNEGFGADAFTFGFNGIFQYTTWGDTVKIWEWAFIRDFGLPLLLLPFSLYFLWKTRPHPTIWLLPIVGSGHFLLPLLLKFETIPGDTKRFFYVAIALFAMIAGLWIEDRFLSHARRSVRMFGWLLIASMFAASALYLPVRLALPNFRIEPVPLIAGMPDATPGQISMYKWVNAHTTQEDLFYQLVLPAGVESPDETVTYADRVRFMAHTGRFSIGPMTRMWPHPEPWASHARTFESTCDSVYARSIDMRYLVLDTQERLLWFVMHCNPAEWKLRFEAGAYPRIYERI